MLSFLTQRLESKREDDPTTRGSSAYDFTGGRTVQVPRDTTCLRVDRSAKLLDGRVNYGHLFSMELPETVIRMDVNLTQGTSCLPPSKLVQAVSVMISDSKAGDVFKSENLKHLRNVAFPTQLDERNLPTFDNTSDLGRILPSKRNRSLAFSFLCNGYALRSRFAGLPIHRVCYYHSHDSTEVALRNLSEVLKAYDCRIRGQEQQDCLGFTPLHILTCSTKHQLEMYKLLIERYPRHLILEDKWGDIPLLYALWGRAPQEIVDLLASSMKKYHPNYKVDWYKMIETFCEALAPPACLEYLLETSRNAFPEQLSELQSIDLGHMVGILCFGAKAPEDHVERFIETYRTALPQKSADLSRGFFRLILHKKFGFKPFWLKIPISERLASLQKREWREEIETMIHNCPTGSSERIRHKRVELTNSVFNKLDLYETMEKMWVLELALWKAKIEDSGDDEKKQDKCDRSRCRITAGSGVIVPNVMPYLRCEYNFFRSGSENIRDSLLGPQRRQ